MKIYLFICLASAMVFIGSCQDLQSLMFQALGIELPPMPPAMPQSLREHLYPRVRQQQLLEQQKQLQDRQRYLAYLTAQQERQKKNNPYGAAYSTTNVRGQNRYNSVYSAANTIRVPGTANSVSVSKGNPYGSGGQSSSPNRSARPSNHGNPYTVSRNGVSTAVVPAPALRPVPIPPQATRIMRSMQQMKAAREQPVKIADAKSAGCTLPGDSMTASILMYGNCRNPSARLICEAEMMTCMNVGMSAMCCPYGVNNLALDTIGYMNKLQHFMSEFV